MTGRGRKTLSTDDRILWGKVARSTRPMPGRMEDIEALEQAIAEVDVEQQVPVVKKAAPSLRRGETTRTFEDMAYQAPPQPKPAPGRHQPLERPVKRKIAKGRLELEARIDLHGMFQDEAHGLLHAFIQRAFDRGLRHVLVITGKGTSMGSDGALKRAVPMWFAKPEFRHLISSWETAAPNHGGEGALYVRLARGRGAGE
ncbi:MAG: Smr/MutS family protein [Rhizobium sp.]|nr:Smr/MutS family protein [Rhizobium sp.]